MTVLELAWEQLIARYGLPFNSIGESGARDFIVIGYGKLGGIELNYGSDLDLVFMHDAADAQTDGTRAVDGQAFCMRLGQRIIHLKDGLISEVEDVAVPRRAEVLA